MVKGLYAIYDKQSEIHGRIFEAVNDIIAKRVFSSMSENPESELHKYPQDYKLVSLGTYDSKTGLIVSKNPEGVI